ncbi:MAG: dienelactone hydrolase family protein [Acidimicrobiales bacterium]
MTGAPQPSTGLEWVGDAVSRNVREREFRISRNERVAPGVLWTPAEADGPRPLVLMAHGASGHKRQDYVVSMALRLVRHHGFAAAALDGPVHGDRRPFVRPGAASDSGVVFIDFAQLWSSDEAMTDEMIGDYQASLDSLQLLPEVGDGPVGWWGLSMGTILGLPLVAAEPRIGAAVLGLMGIAGPTRDRIAADAVVVTCPVLFLLQWDDELFERRLALDLFGALGSTDKRLHAHPGEHGAVPAEEMDASEAFLAERLGG